MNKSNLINNKIIITNNYETTSVHKISLTDNNINTTQNKLTEKYE